MSGEMKEIIISIRPKWCKLITDGLKTVEVRKTRPKLAGRFKVYIYCTQGAGRNTFNVPVSYEQILTDYVETGDMKSLNCPIGNGKVIGEFICDHVYQYTTADHLDGTDISTEEMTAMSCLSRQELEQYELSAEPKENQIYLIGLYGWHISELKIYQQPKGLNEFGLKSAPQSWQYIKGRENNARRNEN